MTCIALQLEEETFGGRDGGVNGPHKSIKKCIEVKVQ